MMVLGNAPSCSISGQRALAQLAYPPLISVKWRVRSWVQYPLGVCNLPIKKLVNATFSIYCIHFISPSVE